MADRRRAKVFAGRNSAKLAVRRWRGVAAEHVRCAGRMAAASDAKGRYWRQPSRSFHEKRADTIEREALLRMAAQWDRLAAYKARKESERM